MPMLDQTGCGPKCSLDGNRHRVIDRRITQGTRSDAGQRYHERMWTAIATCGKQGRSFFQSLHEPNCASLSGGEPPWLLPE